MDCHRISLLETVRIMVIKNPSIDTFFVKKVSPPPEADPPLAEKNLYLAVGVRQRRGFTYAI